VLASKNPPGNSEHIQVILTREINLHIGGKRANSYHGVAQMGFGTIGGIAPVVDFVNRLDVDARGIGRGEGEHRDW
jgi:hypothetical protein